MSEWPEGWYRDSGAGAEPGPADPTVQLPVGGRPLPGGERGGAGPSAGQVGMWPAQPPVSSRSGGGQPAGAPAVRPARGPGGPGGPGRYGPGSPGTSRMRRWLRPGRIVAALLIVVALVLVGSIGMYFYLNGKLSRANVLVDYPGRPAPGAGQNWLIAGSDSRDGLTTAQENEFSTGHDVSGQRSDTIMVLHIPSNGGRPVLISLPRDSYVQIPGYGWNKINAAYSFGGPKLLAETVQNATGLYINHYMGIGFGGFVNVVDDIGGVRMCIKYPLHDVASGLNIKAGCQTLSGGEALGYVRDRHDFADQDLQRVQDQRLFLHALLSKMTSPGVMLNPFASIPAASGVAGTVTVDQGASLYQLLQVAFALRNPESTTVPIANANYLTPAGDAVQWNQSAALELFNDLRTDKTVPPSLISGSSQSS